MPKVPRWKSHGINGKRNGSFGTFDSFDQSGVPLVQAEHVRLLCENASILKEYLPSRANFHSRLKIPKSAHYPVFILFP